MNKDELRAQAKRVANRRREAAAEMPGVTQAQLGLSGKTTQLTVTIQRGLYMRLKAWPDAMKLPQRLGRISVPTVEVMRALIEEMLESEELSERISERIMDSLKTF